MSREACSAQSIGRPGPGPKPRPAIIRVVTFQRFINWLQQNTVLIVIGASVGMSALQWLARKLREQQAINEQRRRAAARKYEELRTGRAAAPPSPTDLSRPTPLSMDEELRMRREALARQRQLEELRRRQRESGKGAPQPRQSPPTVARLPSTGPMSSGTIVPGAPRPPARKPKPQRPPGAGPRPAKSGSPRPAQAKQPTARSLEASLPTTQWEARHDPEGEGATTRPRPHADTPTGARVAETRSLPSQAEEWRRAVVMLEALAPPVCLRPSSWDAEAPRAF